MHGTTSLKEWLRIQGLTFIHLVCAGVFGVVILACIRAVEDLRLASYLDPNLRGLGMVWGFFAQLNGEFAPTLDRVSRASTDNPGGAWAVAVGLWVVFTLFNVQTARIARKHKVNDFIRRMSLADRERFETLRGMGGDLLAAETDWRRRLTGAGTTSS